MKKLALLFLLFFCINAASAQGNLQFNQVVNTTFTGPGNASGAIIGTITVPAGKVWKVERTSLSDDYGDPVFYPVYSTNYWAHIGDFLVWNSSSSYPQQLFPLWLSEGTYDVTARTYGSTNYNFAISAIEFNVIP